MTTDLILGVAAEEPMRAWIEGVLHGGGFQPVIAAGSADELVAACADRRPHVAVQSLTRARTATVRRLAARMPRTRIVAVVGTVDRRLVRAALRAGADGVVMAGEMAMTLPVVVRSVSLGQASVPRQPDAHLDARALSRRERQVLDLVGEGLGNAEIAARLCVAETTVKRHLASVFIKLGVHSRIEAVAHLGDRPPGARRRPPLAGPTWITSGGQA
jgi:DNA-binding NarL/FixJ family response regulator